MRHPRFLLGRDGSWQRGGNGDEGVWGFADCRGVLALLSGGGGEG